MTFGSVLIVDDEQELASLYKELVSLTGLDVVSFTNPILALEHYRQSPHNYSIVMTDLRMPRMNGIKLANELGNSTPGLKYF